MSLKLKSLTKKDKVVALERLARKYGVTAGDIRRVLLKVELLRFIREHPTI